MAKKKKEDKKLTKDQAVKKILILKKDLFNIRFKKIGAAAEAANLFSVFKIPAKKEDRLTNAKKGKVILVKSTAKLNLLMSSTNPGAIK